MIDRGKKNIAGIMIDAVDYQAAIERILLAARRGDNYAVSALAVHGVMTGAENSEHRFRLNSLDLVVPDGQPVRWALNILHKSGLPDRVCGPELTQRLLSTAATADLPVFFYGTTPDILKKLRRQLDVRFAGLKIAGMEPSKFRQLTVPERAALVERIRESGAKILFVGLGCPRQEIFAFEVRPLLSMPIIAVGAAFPFIARTLPQAPKWMQSWGLEWLFRFVQEPRRLWRRYLVLNPIYVYRILRQSVGKHFPTHGQQPDSEFLFG